MRGKELQQYEERSVDFYGDDILSVRDENGDVWAAVKVLCRNAGVKSSKDQYEKIRNDGVIRWGEIPLPSKGGIQRTFCIHIDDIPMWLGGISLRSTSEVAQERLRLYKRECAGALRDYWYKGRAENPRLLDVDTDIDIDRDKELIRATVKETISELESRHRLVGQTQAFREDVETLISTATKLPPLSDWAQRRIVDHVDEYLGIRPEVDISKIIIGVTNLTPELLSRLHLGEKWCLDKIMLYFPREAPTRKRLKQLCEKFGIEVQNYSYPINKLFQYQLFRDQHQYRRRVEDMVMFYNLSKETITRNCNSVRKELETVFKSNIVDVPYKGYHNYIRSPYWYNKRDAFRAVFNVCWDCNKALAPTNISIHHLTYDRLGNEGLDDIITLCKECHAGRHPEKMEK